jgi:predicted ester cyclase
MIPAKAVMNIYFTMKCRTGPISEEAFMDLESDPIADVADRFIQAFNNDDWDVVREVVSPSFVLHHPMGGDRQLGAEGMIDVWSHFKAALPDSWHPIPIMITEGPYLANLLPTYGNFNGDPHQGIQPTGKWLEYGMVNVVRIEGGQLVEAWFGMDPVEEMSQMGAFPPMPQRQLGPEEEAKVELFHRTINTDGREYDNVTAFGDVVVAFEPPQYAEGASTRRVEAYRYTDGSLNLEYSNEFKTDPSYPGDPSVDGAVSRALVERYVDEVMNGHDLDALADITSQHIMVHPTAMPCEASYYGLSGVCGWLGGQWKAFPDLAVTDHFIVARGDIVAMCWMARGKSEGGFMGLPPTGKVVEYTGTSMFRIEDGRIAEIWETRNTLGIMLQLNPELGKGDHGH